MFVADVKSLSTRQRTIIQYSNSTNLNKKW